MANLTGCPPYYAVDNLFDKKQTECNLNIPVFVGVLALFGLVHLGVGITRTKVIRGNMLKRKAPIDAFSWQAVIPWITLTQTWAAFVAVVMTPVVWAVYSPGGFMLTIFAVLFGISSEMWLAKLVRLGARIIPKSALMHSDSEGVSNPEKTRLLQGLSKADNVIRCVSFVTRLSLVAQFIFGCLLYSIMEESVSYLRVAMALQSFATCSWVFIYNWQYLRCEHAIKAVSKMADPARSQEKTSSPEIQIVLKKMREHRIILICLGAPGVIIYAVWAGGVYTTSWWVMLIGGFFDAATNGTVLFTFIRKRSKAGDRADPALLSIHPSSSREVGLIRNLHLSLKTVTNSVSATT